MRSKDFLLDKSKDGFKGLARTARIIIDVPRGAINPFFTHLENNFWLNAKELLITLNAFNLKYERGRGFFAFTLISRLIGQIQDLNSNVI